MKRRKEFFLRVVIILVLVWKIETLREFKCGKPGLTPICPYSFQKESYFEGEEVTYYCRERNRCYTFDNETRTCLKNNTWSGKIPQCYAELNLTSIMLKPTSSVSRIPNMNLLVDKNKTTCLRSELDTSATWEIWLGRISTISLIKLDISMNSSINVAAFVIGRNEPKLCSQAFGFIASGSSLFLSCPPGLEGNRTKIETSSYHQHYFKICEISIYTSYGSLGCLKPDTPLNGNGQKIVTDNRASSYNFTCKHGYELVGPSQVHCLPDGTWSSSTTFCRKKVVCNQLPFVANGELLTNSTAVNSTAWLVCNEGFRPLSNDRIFCLPTGSWTTLSLRCEPIECDSNPYVPHGKGILLDGSALYGSRLQIQCDPYYNAVYSTLRQCQSDGSWGNLDICEEVNCGAISIYEIPEAGEWITYNLSLPIFRVLICEPGYHIEGSPPVIQCLPNGSWTHSTAKCEKSVEAKAWDSDWSPSSMFMAAIAVGAGTSVCLLSLAVCIFILRKKHSFKCDSAALPLNKDATYDKVYHNPSCNTNEVIELTAHHSSEHSTLDTDPVYAQPFEAALKPLKVFKDDLYSTHIYAEPIDSKVDPPKKTPNSENGPQANKLGQNNQYANIRDELIESKCPITTSHENEKISRCSNTLQLLGCNQLQMIDNELYQGDYFSSI